MRSRFSTFLVASTILLPAAAQAAERRPIVAVFDVEAKGIKLSVSLLERLSDYLSSRLAETGRFMVIPRDDLKKRLLGQKAKSYKQCYDRSCQIEMGREMAADKTIATRVIKFGTRCMLTSTLYDLKKAATEIAATVRGKCGEEDLVNSLDKVVNKLCGKNDRPVSNEVASKHKRFEGFVRIEPGSFMMGSPAGEAGRSDNESLHRVTITRPFSLQVTEVTQGQYRALMSINPSKFSSCGDDCPVEQVSWREAAAYANALSRMDGLPECYTGDEFKGLSCKGYRLPTEAEWEYAARAGSTGARHGNLDAIAWYRSNSGGKTHPVGKKQPNAWGLYDMIGNVWEWTNDWYEKNYSGSATDPTGPVGGSERVNGGGGSWNFDASYCRSARRGGSVPDSRFYTLGFRLARSLETTR